MRCGEASEIVALGQVVFSTSVFRSASDLARSYPWGNALLINCDVEECKITNALRDLMKRETFLPCVGAAGGEADCVCREVGLAD